MQKIQVASPHIDDAAFSVGGTLHHLSQTFDIQIFNVFSQSGWTNPNNIAGKKYSTKAKDVSQIRKAEDSHLRSIIASSSHYADFDEYPLRERSFGNDEYKNKDRVAEYLKSNLLKDDLCFFPLGIDHPDHALLREIGWDLVNDGYSIVFYEDLPYATFANYDYEEFHKMMRLDKGLTPAQVKIDIHAKVKAMKLYQSQLSDNWLRQIVNYSYCLKDNSFYERLWVTKETVVPFGSA